MKNGTLPQTEDLLNFLTIVKEGSLSAAARKLQTPKSTVSRRLSRLEEEMGVRLFHRNHQRLELTTTGQQLLQLAETALDGLQQFSNAVAQTRSQPTGTLRLSAPMDLSVYHEVWLDFVSTYPGIDLEVVFTNRYVDVIREGFDVVLRAGTGTDDTLTARKLGFYRLHAVASPAYVQRGGVPVRRDDLFQHDCLLLQELSSPSFSQGKISGRHLIFNDIQLVLEGVKQGMGIGILPEILVQKELDSGELLSVLEEFNPLEVSLYAMYPERKFLRTAVLSCLDFMESAFQPTPACFA